MRIQRNCLIPKAWDFPPTTIGEHIKRRRLELGLYQKDVATQIGVDPITVLNWEKSTTRPTIRHILKAIQFLGYDPEPQSKGTIAEMLKAKRRDRGISQKDAAQSIGVDPCTWSRWENGGTIMCLDHRGLVASFLGISTAIVNTDIKRR